ncbi:MAG: deoxyribose-phosphate aldolase [Aquificae bacterium]|nr:deoxyribose-phosphate aldolase [Aquificota bacterium]
MHLSLNIAKYIDHTNLKPYATSKDIEKLCKEAIEYGFYAVCVNPFYISFAKEILKKTDTKVATVVGFPLGANTLKTKLTEATNACYNGADELDIVWNIGAFKEGKYDYVESELKTIISYTEKCIHKIIVETAYLTHDEKVIAVKIVKNSGAEFIKTSTGFAPKGATIEDVKLFKSLAGEQLKVKASGGIRDYKTALNMIKAGADRIGTSYGVQIVKGTP